MVRKVVYRKESRMLFVLLCNIVILSQLEEDISMQVTEVGVIVFRLFDRKVCKAIKGYPLFQNNL